MEACGQTFPEFGDVSWHGFMDVSQIVLPIEVKATVIRTYEVYGDCVVGLEDCKEMI